MTRPSHANKVDTSQELGDLKPYVDFAVYHWSFLKSGFSNSAEEEKVFGLLLTSMQQQNRKWIDSGEMIDIHGLEPRYVDGLIWKGLVENRGFYVTVSTKGFQRLAEMVVLKEARTPMDPQEFVRGIKTELNFK